MTKINKDNVQGVVNKALRVAFKEFGIEDAEQDGGQGLSCEHKSVEEELEMVAALTLFIHRFAEASMGMYITIVADKPNEELMLIKRYHHTLAHMIDNVRDMLMSRVADNEFISSKTVVRNNEV